MINNDWERFGDEIRRTIQDAVDSGDFRRLNQTVSDTVGRAVDNVSRGLKNGGWYREAPSGMGNQKKPVREQAVSGTGGTDGGRAARWERAALHMAVRHRPGSVRCS